MFANFVVRKILVKVFHKSPSCLGDPLRCVILWCGRKCGHSTYQEIAHRSSQNQWLRPIESLFVPDIFWCYFHCYQRASEDKSEDVPHWYFTSSSSKLVCPCLWGIACKRGTQVVVIKLIKLIGTLYQPLVADLMPESRIRKDSNDNSNSKYQYD